MLICYYYQTFIGLEGVLQNPGIVDVINVSAIHFGRKSGSNRPYINLNDHEPDDPIFDQMWKETAQAHQQGTNIHLMLGGAGTAYQVLFSNFNLFYPLLKNTIKLRSWITGIDLDIEEPVTLENTKMLIKQLRQDFGKEFKITMAPLSSSLISNGSGMSSFSYKELFNSSEGDEISWFNVQAYGDFSINCFDQMVQNGYPASKLVYGMESSEFRWEPPFKPLKV